MSRPPFSGGAAAIDKIAKNGAILSVLLRFSRRDAMTMREFELASKVPPKRARRLRDTMRQMGLIEAQITETRGVAGLWDIRPTKLGHAIMTRALEVNDLLDAAGRDDPHKTGDDG